MLALGAALMVAAQLAGAASERRGGILVVGTTGASVQVDPQLAYITTAWWLEYATAAKLYNYPDKRGPAGSLLEPEVASSYKVSNGGKRYTFFIRKGFRFSDGTPVTAKNFAYAIDRTANHDLASPGGQFITDPDGTNIVGAKDVNEGNGTHVEGVRVKGSRLIINLTKPDGTFMSKITMPFFQATSTKLPLRREIVTVSDNDLPSAGPYYMSRNQVNVLTSLRRNPYWTRGPGRMRPRNLTGLDLQWNLNEHTAFNQVLANELDEGPLPAERVREVADRFGVNRSRFWTMPVNCTGYLPLNMANPLFKGNLQLRQAINYAVSRRQYVAQAGPYAGGPWTHIFNPGVPGWKDVDPYPLDPDLPKARALAAGHFRDGKIVVYYRSGATTNEAQYQIVRQDLINIGFQPQNIIGKGFSGGGIYDPMGKRGTDADLGVSMGWCSDYPDPFDWLNILFYGPWIKPENNVNYSYMDLPRWNRKLEAAAKLVGPRRFKVYGQMDLDLMREVAPVAAERTYNNRYFFSDRVDPKGLVYQAIYQDWSIPALRLK
jgi:oligopeptide transport system substrate-binding protein